MARHLHRLVVIVSNHTPMRGDTDDNHTDMGHIVHNGRSAFILPSFSQSNHSWLSSKQMLIIQIQPHCPQNTHTHILKMLKKKGLFFVKKPIAEFRPHQMTDTSQRENSNKKESVFFHFHSVSHSVSNTHVFFLQPRRSFLSVSYFITDTNSNSP